MNVSKKIILIAAVLVLTVVFSACARRTNAETPNAQIYLEARISPEAARLLTEARIQVFSQPTQAPDFVLPLLDGENTSLSSFRGNVVFLYFWTTWCPSCRIKMPSMEVLYQRFNDQGLSMLAVNLRESADTVRQFIQSNGYSYTVMLDSTGAAGQLYGVTAIPTTFIIDRSGMIVGRVVGGIDWDTPEVFAAFEALL